MTRTPTHRTPVLAGCLAAVLLLPGVAAAETELYGGVGIGYSTYKVDSTGFDGSDFGVRQLVGFNWGDYLGVEVGYIDFGTAKDNVGSVFFPVNQTIESWGYDVSLFGRYPLDEELDLFAKAGILRWDARTNFANSPFSEKDDGDDLLVGVGLDFRGTGRVHVRMAGELIDADFADSWWMLSASLLYSFPVGN
ncbi:MAG: porin family protein [Gammaproteobacteria bacterium]|jgi:OOP family OmpA-OmpF porin|nr:porin family protein [Gammaproteobacteria bacterium]